MFASEPSISRHQDSNSSLRNAYFQLLHLCIYYSLLMSRSDEVRKGCFSHLVVLYVIRGLFKFIRLNAHFTFLFYIRLQRETMLFYLKLQTSFCSFSKFAHCLLDYSYLEDSCLDCAPHFQEASLMANQTMPDPRLPS